MIQKEEERELIERSREGDAQAFMRLVSGYQDRLYRKAYSLLGNEDDAQDTLQEALISAYRALPRFRGESGIYTWLYRILINKCRDFQRSTKNSRLDSLETGIPVSDDRVTVEKNVELSEESSVLIDAVNSLEKKYRQILLMRYYDDLSYQEIAEVTGLNIGTVKSRLFKGRELLKRLLTEQGKGEEYFAESS